MQHRSRVFGLLSKLLELSLLRMMLALPLAADCEQSRRIQGHMNPRGAARLWKAPAVTASDRCRKFEAMPSLKLQALRCRRRDRRLWPRGHVYCRAATATGRPTSLAGDCAAGAHRKRFVCSAHRSYGSNVPWRVCGAWDPSLSGCRLAISPHLTIGAANRFGGLDITFNNAGVLGEIGRSASPRRIVFADHQMRLGPLLA